MAYQTFWPTTVPRQAPEYVGDSFWAPLTQPLDAGIVGGGSLSDGSDDTYVSLFNDVSGPNGTDNYGSLIAVDFAAMPNINGNDGRFYSLGITCRLMGNALTDSANGGFALYDSTGYRFAGGRFGDFLYGVPLPITSPTTATSPSDVDTIAGSSSDAAAAQALTTDGFTCVIGATDWTDYTTGPFETWRIFEWGLTFDILQAGAATYHAPLRLWPRSDLRHWPPPASRWGSSRRVGGYD